MLNKMSNISVLPSFWHVHYCFSFTNKGKEKNVQIAKLSLEVIRIIKQQCKSELSVRTEAKIL